MSFNPYLKIFSAILLFTSLLNAQSFVAEISNEKVGVSDRFEVSFTFSAENINGLKGFIPPDFSSFLVLSGPNQSTSMQFVNGVSSASLKYSYILQPRGTGRFTIGGAQIEYQGTRYSTGSIRIEVVPASVQPQRKEDEQSISNEEIAKNLFIRATSDKQRAFVGEQITVTYKLYTRLTIASQMSVSKLPQYQGFWAEELETSNNIMFTTEVHDGKQYRVGILKRVALFPSQTGELSVTPFELKVPIQVQKKRRSQSLFDDFFSDPFGRYETIEFAAISNTLKVNVIPLPEQNKPESFKGAVGSFTINSKIDQSETKTDEPVSLKVEISGTGNIKLLDLPEINLPTGFESFDPKTDEQLNRKGQISGTKKIEYLLVPRTAGKREIPSIEFSYFNPAEKKYVTMTTPSYTINVLQGERRDDGIVQTDKQGIKELGKDIMFIKTSVPDFSKKNEMIIRQPGFWTAVALPLIAFIGLVAWKRKEDKLASDVKLLRFSKAEKMAKQRLKKAAAFMSAKEHEKFYDEVSIALFGYLEDKLNIEKSEFTLDKAAQVLSKNGINEDLIGKMFSRARQCEFVRFAPGGGVEDMESMYSDIKEIIVEIESTFGRSKNV